MSKNVVETRGDTNDVTIWRIRVTWWISKATRTHIPTHRAPTRVYTHTHRQICNTCCLSTARRVKRTRLTVTSYVHCLSCSRYAGLYKKWCGQDQSNRHILLNVAKEKLVILYPLPTFHYTLHFVATSSYSTVIQHVGRENTFSFASLITRIPCKYTHISTLSTDVTEPAESEWRKKWVFVTSEQNKNWLLGAGYQFAPTSKTHPTALTFS